ncbi:hypothetical protein ACHAWO_009735 [Cyclotella atomus]|uniref:Uncharacterized protein n=1 Tax=Cyclotella atomus TaxID=382360 RepID=A0ABD3PTU1_9STRA
MKIQLASSLLATPLLPTSALSSSVDLATSSSNTAPTTTKAHRLLQRFKDKHASRQLQSQSSDLGILSDTPRFLEDNYSYYCPRDTCPTELCDCADQGGSLEDCTTELQNVCVQGKLGDCVYEGYIAVYQTVYCPFVSCLGEGFRQNQCDCAFYDLYCSRLEGEECMNVVPDADGGSDKKPFFGCDETELATVCDQAKACKASGDLNGLPDLGTWAGTGTVGLKSNGGVGRVTGVVAAGAVVLSSLFWGLNL